MMSFTVVARVEALLRRSAALQLLVIALVVVAIYSNTIDAPFVLDDMSSIVENERIRDLESFFTARELCSMTAAARERGLPCRGPTPRYVSYLTLALNYRMGGLDVRGYHAANIMIHLLASFVVFALLRLTYRTPLMRRNEPGEASSCLPFVVAVLFAVHPLQIQAVTYTIQRMTSLAALFYLAAVTCYGLSRLSVPEPNAVHGAMHGRLRSSLWLLCSMACAILGIYSKETVLTLPAMLVAYEALFFRGGLRRWLGVALVGGLPLLIAALWLLPALASSDPLSSLDNATRVQSFISRSDYFWTETRVVARYIVLLLLPIGQNIDHDVAISFSLFEVWVILALLAHLLIMFGAAAFFLRHGSDHRSRLVLFGVFWFYTALSLESSFFPIVDVMFEHRVYLPGFGALLALVASATLALDRVSRRRGFVERMQGGIFLAIAIALSTATFVRNQVWRSEISLWEDATAKSPFKARPHYELSLVYLKRGNLVAAHRQWERVLQIDPNHSYALNNMGNLHLLSGDYAKAYAYHKRAVASDWQNAEAHMNLGTSAEQLGHLGEALLHYRVFLQQGKGFPDHLETARRRIAALEARLPPDAEKSRP